MTILIWTGGEGQPTYGRATIKAGRAGTRGSHRGMECLPQTPDLELYGKIYGLGVLFAF